MLTLRRPGRIRKSFHKAATYSLLDAAALASTAPLDLSDNATAPDFVALSFYKIFGFPNIGALIVRKDSAHVLQSRKYFGGGTVDMIITIQDTWHAKKDTSIHDRLEDGTLPFHSIFALDHAMNVHERLYGPNPMKFISHHTAQLGKTLYDGLNAFKHANGTPVCKIYKDDVAVYGDPTLQGATIAFNVVRSDGSLVGYEDVEEAADERNIFVRSGSLCNPGGVATYLGWSPAEMRAAYAAGHRCTNPTQIMMGRPTGVVRVSLGAMSTAADVRALLQFIDEMYVAKEGQPKTAVTQLTTKARTVQLPAMASPATPLTPLPAEQVSFNAFGMHTAPQSTLNPAPERSGSVPNETNTDTAIPAMPQRPRFVPAEYTKRYRPWEDAIRKTQYTPVANVGMEIKVREIDQAQQYGRNANGTPSVKARRFGRSVVNLLRTKSHIPDANSRYVQPTLFVGDDRTSGRP